MSILSRLGNYIFQRRSNSSQNTQQLTRNERDFRTARGLKRNYSYQVPLEMDQLDAAVLSAESPHNPDRRRLYGIYDAAMQDGHLTSVISTRIERILAEAFVMVEEGKPVGKRFNEDHKKLLYRKWFFDFLRYSLESKFWGHSLMEFSREPGTGMVKDIFLLWREHVEPVQGELFMDVHSTTEGIMFRERPWTNFLLEIGDKYDLGILKKATRLVIMKKYSVTDWSRRGERYGQPLLGIKTARQSDKELDALEDMAANFGSNGYVILDDQDQVQIIESSQAFTWQIFDSLAKRMDDEISKLVLGQTMTTDSGSSEAQARVHMDQLDSLSESDMRWLTFTVNDELFPLLKKYGYPLDGFRFEFFRMTEEGEQEAREERMGGAAGKYPGQGNQGQKSDTGAEPNQTEEELRRVEKKSPYLSAGKSTAH